MTNINLTLEENWKNLLKKEFDSEYFLKIISHLEQEKKNLVTVYPVEEKIFNALNLTPLNSIKVVIIGQDPYHGVNQAHGLCFSVMKGVQPPPSLVNIFKELKQDIGMPIPTHGELTKWGKEGVLLLNSILTVRANQAASHQSIGWQLFTDSLITLISDQLEGLIFLLWGRYAQSKESLINQDKHFVLKAAHPSPFSAYDGFFGCKHFSKTNEILKSIGKKPIDWQID
jgi:uracil-DNA glycosylase